MHTCIHIYIHTWVDHRDMASLQTLESIGTALSSVDFSNLPLAAGMGSWQGWFDSINKNAQSIGNGMCVCALCVCVCVCVCLCVCVCVCVWQV